VTESELIGLLAVRYSATAWAFLPQVRNGTGWLRSTIRTADALAMSLYPSRGLHLHGFEVKVARGDWLHELKNPEKAEDFIKWCDFWWIVTPKDLVQPGELPPTWGLIEPKGRGLAVKKEAPRLEPKPMDRLMLAGIMRRVSEVATPEAKIAEAEMRGEEKGKKDEERRWKYEREEHGKFRKMVAEFEKAAGVALNKYSESHNMNFAAAIKIVLAGEDMKVSARLLSFKQTLLNILEQCDQALDKGGDTAKEPAASPCFTAAPAKAARHG